MIRSDFTGTLLGDIVVKAVPSTDGRLVVHVRDGHRPDPGDYESHWHPDSSAITLFGTVDQLLAVAEGIRDAVHVVEMQSISSQVEAERASLAEVE